MTARSSRRLNSGVLTEEILDRDRLLAVRAGATDTDPAHEGPALLTPLLADGPGAATVAFVDGDRFGSWFLGRTTGGRSASRRRL